MSALYGRTSAQTRVLRLRSEQKGQKGRLLTQTLGGEEFPLHLFGPDGKVQAQFCDTAGTPILDTPLGVHTDTPGLATLFAVGGDRANANPQVAMMNTLFLREHNRMARLIETHNPAWEDERVFQVARNNLIVMFIKIVVEEYINHINTSVFKFIADPRVAWKAKWNRPNWMTAEFSLLYRWHSLVPENLKLNGANVPGTTMLLDNSWLTQRGLANAFVEISANNATRLGIGNSASFLVSVEKKAINQARENEIATYNDYRVAMGLDRAKDFGDIVGKTSDKPENTRRTALAAQLKRLYGSVDNVEYYVGLFVEPPQKNGPLPELIMAMVAMDAFSQALTNPLLSEHVYGDHRVETFTAEGLVEIEATKRLRDVLVRNSSGVADRFVGMTRADWRRK